MYHLLSEVEQEDRGRRKVTTIEGEESRCGLEL